MSSGLVGYREIDAGRGVQKPGAVHGEGRPVGRSAGRVGGQPGPGVSERVHRHLPGTEPGARRVDQRTRPARHIYDPTRCITPRPRHTP